MANGAARDDDGRRSGVSDSSTGARRLAVVAAALLCLSGFLLYTLVLGEKYLERDRNAVVEDAFTIGIPAFAGLVVAAFALRRARRH